MGGSDSPGLLVGYCWRRRCIGVVGPTLTLERGYDEEEEEEKKKVLVQGFVFLAHVLCDVVR